MIDFLRHWYVRSLKIYSNRVLNELEKLDKILAWKITLKNLFSPLYKDYTFIGYILGFVLRLGRLIVASGFYLVFFVSAFFLYLLWLLIPPVLVGIFLGMIRIS